MQLTATQKTVKSVNKIPNYAAYNPDATICFQKVIFKYELRSMPPIPLKQKHKVLQEPIPKVHGELIIGDSHASDKMIFPCANGAFHRIAAMHMGWH